MTFKLLVEIGSLIQNEQGVQFNANGPIGSFYDCQAGGLLRPCGPSDVSIRQPAGLEPVYKQTKEILDKVGTPGQYTEEYKKGSPDNATFWPIKSHGTHETYNTQCCDDMCAGATNAEHFYFVYSSPMNISNPLIQKVIKNPWVAGANVSAGTVNRGFPTITAPVDPISSYDQSEFNGDGKVYVVLKYTPFNCSHTEYSTYNLETKVYMYHDSDILFWSRCCSNDISSEAHQYFCPSEYSKGKSGCKDITENFIVDTNKMCDGYCISKDITRCLMIGGVILLLIFLCFYIINEQ